MPRTAANGDPGAARSSRAEPHGPGTKRTVGRYTLYDEIAAGGMATVYLARLVGEERFARLVAVKVLHAQYSKDEVFRAMFLDEARLAARVRHPNVVATLDVLQSAGELFLVMDFVQGESLSRLVRAGGEGAAPPDVRIAAGLLVDTLEGLHAAHEARDEHGVPLDIVHRDVSPQNVLVGVDGVSHVADFGVAKAAGRMAEKWSNQETVKGKAGYMAPEQLRGVVDRRADVYAAGVVLWETLTGQRLFGGGSFMEVVTRALESEVSPPSTIRPDVPSEVDAVVMKALARDRDQRFASAREMAIALERATPRAGAREIGTWVERVAKGSLEVRRGQIARIERGETAVPQSSLPSEVETVVSVLTEQKTARSVVATAGDDAPSGSRRLPFPQAVAWGLGVTALAASLLASRALVQGDPAGAPAMSRAVAASAQAPARTESAVRASAAPDPPRDPVTAPVTSVPLSKPASSTASAPRATHVVGPSRPPSPQPRPSFSSAASASSSSSASASPPCRLAELPDQDGILHPRMICP